MKSQQQQQQATNTTKRLEISSSISSSKDSMRFNIIKNSTSNNNLNSNTNNLLSTIYSSNASNNNTRLDSSTSINKNVRQFDCNKSIDSIDETGADDANSGNGDGGSGGGGGEAKKAIKRNTSLISFKSLDFNLKTIYSSMKGKHSGGKDTSCTSSGKNKDSGAGGTGTASSSKTSITKTPYVRVETVDQDETENLLTFPQSPYAHRGSFEKTNSQYLSTVQHTDYSRSQTNSPFLCINTSPNLRRSSTSDIIDKKPIVSPNVENRRPSTSDLLRRARERKGGESSGNKIGRSVSQGGLQRGGRTGRRTSIAF